MSVLIVLTSAMLQTKPGTKQCVSKKSEILVEVNDFKTAIFSDSLCFKIKAEVPITHFAESDCQHLKVRVTFHISPLNSLFQAFG